MSRLLGTVGHPWWANGHGAPLAGWRDATNYGTATAASDAGARELAGGTSAWCAQVADNTGAYVYSGTLRETPPGDFVIGVRLAVRRLLASYEVTTSTLWASAVYIDGTDADADDLYGGTIHYDAASDGDCQECAVSATSGTRWTNPSYAGDVLLRIPVLDVFFQRTSTSLLVSTAKPDTFPVAWAVAAEEIRGRAGGHEGPERFRLGRNHQRAWPACHATARRTRATRSEWVALRRVCPASGAFG